MRRGGKLGDAKSERALGLPSAGAHRLRAELHVPAEGLLVPQRRRLHRDHERAVLGDGAARCEPRGASWPRCRRLLREASDARAVLSYAADRDRGGHRGGSCGMTGGGEQDLSAHQLGVRLRQRNRRRCRRLRMHARPVSSRTRAPRRGRSACMSLER